MQALVKADASLARLSPEDLRRVVRLLGRACQVSVSGSVGGCGAV